MLSSCKVVEDYCLRISSTSGFQSCFCGIGVKGFSGLLNPEIKVQSSSCKETYCMHFWGILQRITLRARRVCMHTALLGNVFFLVECSWGIENREIPCTLPVSLYLFLSTAQVIYNVSREAFADGRKIQWTEKAYYKAADFHSSVDTV